MDGLLLAVTFAAALGCGLNAGVFFAFSSFVMPALARLAPAHGVAAMQSINVAAVTVAFMLVLFGTAAICLALTVWGIAQWETGFAPYLVAGGALYLAGTIGVTVAITCPETTPWLRSQRATPTSDPPGPAISPSGRRSTTPGPLPLSGRRPRSPLRSTSAERCPWAR